MFLIWETLCEFRYFGMFFFGYRRAFFRRMDFRFGKLGYSTGFLFWSVFPSGRCRFGCHANIFLSFGFIKT